MPVLSVGSMAVHLINRNITERDCPNPIMHYMGVFEQISLLLFFFSFEIYNIKIKEILS